MIATIDIPQDCGYSSPYVLSILLLLTDLSVLEIWIFLIVKALSRCLLILRRLKHRVSMANVRLGKLVIAVHLQKGLHLSWMTE